MGVISSTSALIKEGQKKKVLMNNDLTRKIIKARIQNLTLSRKKDRNRVGLLNWYAFR